MASWAVLVASWAVLVASWAVSVMPRTVNGYARRREFPPSRRMEPGSRQPARRCAKTSACWRSDIPAGSAIPTEPAAIASGDFGGTGGVPHIVDRAVGERVEVDVEQVGAVVLGDRLAAADGVGEPLAHARACRLRSLDVALEEARVGDVAGLEEADERGEPREALRVGVGAADEREHLELALEVGAVVGEHVHEVVLGEVTRGAPLALPGSAKPRPSYISHDRAAERARRAGRRNASSALRGRGRRRLVANGSVTASSACAARRVDSS